MARRDESRQRDIAAVYRKQIRSGELGVGAKLPSEKELRAEFGASQPTVREAMKMLEEEGLVESRAGAGYFVPDRRPSVDLYLAGSGSSEREPEPYFVIAGEHGSAGREGFEHRAPATVAWADLLDVEAGAALVLRGFVERVDGRPFLMSRSYLPQWLAEEPPAVNPAPDDLAIGQLALFDRHVTLVGADVTARPPEFEVARALDMGRGVSSLVITTRWLVDRPGGEPVQAAVEVICRGVPARLRLPLELILSGMSASAT